MAQNQMYAIGATVYKRRSQLSPQPRLPSPLYLAIMTLLSTGSYNVELCEQTMFIILSAGPNAQTDASSCNQPSGTSPARDANGRVSYYEEVNDVDERKWRSKLGRWLYEDIVKKELARRGIGASALLSSYTGVLFTL